MALEQPYIDIRNDFGDEQYRELRKRLVGTFWRHYKGGEYLITDIHWDAEHDEWAIEYARVSGRLTILSFTRRSSNWCSQLVVGPRFTEII